MHIPGLRWFALSALLATACDDTKLTHPVTVNSQDEAATVLVSVGIPNSWDQVAAAMRPNFALTGDQALAQVLPTTQRLQEQVLNAFGASLSVGLGPPQTSSTLTQGSTLQDVLTTNTPATGSPSSTQTTTTGATSSETSNSQPVSVPTPPSGAPASVTALSPSVIQGDIGVSPRLKYSAARDLLEAVQMMNSELQNAAVLRCYVPFLVRLKVNVAGYRPNLGYTLHTRIAFFPNEADTGSGTTPMLYVDGDGTATRKTPCTDAGYLPQIMPIIAADDIERALKSRTTEAATQIAFALSAMLQGVGVNAGANNLHQAIKAISGQDYNSLFSVARQSDNTLYVRIGAADQATAGNALSTQSYDVGVLLLAPRTYFDAVDDKGNKFGVDRQIRVVTYTQFRNAADGRVLDGRPVKTLVAQIDRIMQKEVLVGADRADMLAAWQELSPVEKETVARKLGATIQNPSDDEYLRLLAMDTFPGTKSFTLKPLSGSPAAQSLWTAASSLLADTVLKSAYFQLRFPDDITLADQTALVLDDGKARSVVQLQAQKGTSASSLVAVLKDTTKDAPTQTYTLPAQSITLDPATRLLTMYFPSLAQWGIGNIDPTNLNTRLIVSQPSCNTETLCPKLIAPTTGFPVLYLKASKDDQVASFAFSQDVTQLVADKRTGGGTATVTITKLPAGEEAKLTLSGADVVSVSSQPSGVVKASVDGYTVTKDAKITFTLTNLHAGAVVTIAAEGKGPQSAGKAPPLKFTVIDG